MKNRILSMVLVLCLIMTLVPVTTFAAEAVTEGNTVSVTIQPGETIAYEFTPGNAGYYHLYTEGTTKTDDGLVGIILDGNIYLEVAANGTSVAAGYMELMFEATSASTAYTITVTNESYSEILISLSVTKIDSSALLRYGDTKTVEIAGGETLEFFFEPEKSDEYLIYYSVDNRSYNFNVDLEILHALVEKETAYTLRTTEDHVTA